MEVFPPYQFHLCPFTGLCFILNVRRGSRLRNLVERRNWHHFHKQRSKLDIVIVFDTLTLLLLDLML